jgi:hypothetical protein
MSFVARVVCLSIWGTIAHHHPQSSGVVCLSIWGTIAHHPPQSSGVVCLSILENMVRQGILCLLAMKKWNGSRHLVFWSLGTLTGLRDRVRRLVAQREGINTPNTPYLR